MIVSSREKNWATPFQYLNYTYSINKPFYQNYNINHYDHKFFYEFCALVMFIYLDNYQLYKEN